jgi:hypothetical protein
MPGTSSNLVGNNLPTHLCATGNVTNLIVIYVATVLYSMYCTGGLQCLYPPPSAFITSGLFRIFLHAAVSCYVA